MTTSNKRIVAYHISRLQDKSRDVRLKSIAELALMVDEDALSALRALVEKDSVQISTTFSQKKVSDLPVNVPGGGLDAGWPVIFSIPTPFFGPPGQGSKA